MITAEAGWERTFPLGVPFACALREDVLRRAFEGDPAAQRLVRARFPTAVPADLRRAERDARIREMAADLWAALPNARPHRVAAILREAGASLERGRGLSDRSPFNALDCEARAALEREIRAILEWAPPHAGNRWPALRQLLVIIAHPRTLAASVVETANT